jgi:hypothetical protein
VLINNIHTDGCAGARGAGNNAGCIALGLVPGLCALAADADSGGGGGPGGGGGGTSHWHWSHSDGASHISYGESLMEYTERRLSDSTARG